MSVEEVRVQFMDLKATNNQVPYTMQNIRINIVVIDLGVQFLIIHKKRKAFIIYKTHLVALIFRKRKLQ